MAFNKAWFEKKAAEELAKKMEENPDYTPPATDMKVKTSR